MVNHYQVLDILPGASHNEILHAYTRAKMTYGGNSLASYSLLDEENNAKILVEIEEAFSVLGNPARRREFDLAMNFPTWTDNVDREDPLKSIERLTSGPTVRSVAEAALPERAPVMASMQPKPQLQAVPNDPQFEPNPEFEKRILENKECDGAFLRAVRIYRQLTAEHVADRCKLTPRHILNIEEERKSELHAPVYLRGHLILVAKILDLPDPENLAKNYLLRVYPKK